MTTTNSPMPLDAHSRSLLERTAAMAADIAPGDLTVARRRALSKAANAFLVPASGNLPIPRQDLSVDLPGRSLPARLYRPEADAVPSQCADLLLVFFHGGGWVVGDLDTHDNACAFLTRELGCTVLSVEYRKAPEHPFPAPSDDAQEAYAWAWQHLLSFGCSRIAAAGDSAGGHLAAHAVFANADVPTSASLLFYPVSDTDFGNQSYRQRGSGPGLTSPGMVWFWEQFLGGKSTSTDPAAVLMRQVWTRQPPPAVVSLAWHDPLHDEGLAYAGLLEKSGAKVHVHRAMDMSHGYLRQCRANVAAGQHVVQACKQLAQLLASV